MMFSSAGFINSNERMCILQGITPSTTNWRAAERSVARAFGAN